MRNNGESKARPGKRIQVELRDDDLIRLERYKKHSHILHDGPALRKLALDHLEQIEHTVASAHA